MFVDHIVLMPIPHFIEVYIQHGCQLEQITEYISEFVSKMDEWVSPISSDNSIQTVSTLVLDHPLNLHTSMVASR